MWIVTNNIDLSRSFAMLNLIQMILVLWPSMLITIRIDQSIIVPPFSLWCSRTVETNSKYTRDLFIFLLRCPCSGRIDLETKAMNAYEYQTDVTSKREHKNLSVRPLLLPNKVPFPRPRRAFQRRSHRSTNVTLDSEGSAR